MSELAIGQRMIMRSGYAWEAEIAPAQGGTLVRLTPKFVFVTGDRGGSYRLERSELETRGKFASGLWTWFTEETFDQDHGEKREIAA